MIRKFRECDLHQVMEIWLDSNILAHDFIPEKYWSDNFDTVREILPKADVYVYECGDGSLGGFIGLDGSFIEGLFVRSDLRSIGIGRLLTDHVKEKNFSLQLCVDRKNSRAVQFYIREDFAVTAERIDTDTGETEFVMTWQR